MSLIVFAGSAQFIGAGLLMALQRLIAIVLALFSGPLTDRLGAHRLLLPCTLAIAIGYPDLVASINVTINQTGQAIENILIIMAAYLSVSLSISAFMNWYNKRIALRER